MSYKKLTVLVIAVVLICVFPSTAMANPSIHDFYVHQLYIDDVPEMDLLEVYGYEEDGNRFRMERYEVKNHPNKKDFSIYNETCLSFELEIILKDGTTQTSNRIKFSDNMNYRYNLKKNLLEKSFIYHSIPFYYPFAYIIYLICPILLACAFAVLIEWIIALLFKIKPSKYVVFINIVSNIVMNILLAFAIQYLIFNYYIIVLVLELIVFGGEFAFYKYKYRSISKVRLLIFAFAANAISWGLYALLRDVFLINI